jgi:hypothetical protein
MKAILLTLALAFAAEAYSQDEKIILQLIKKDMENNVISKIELFSSEPTPYSGSVHSTYHVNVDGKTFDVPVCFLFNLQNRMLSHSHVGQSYVNITQKKNFICYMIQHSQTEYNVRYLTYKENEVVSAELKTVYNNGLDDCTEDSVIRPKDNRALEDILMNKAVLETISEYVKAQ